MIKSLILLTTLCALGTSAWAETAAPSIEPNASCSMAVLDLVPLGLPKTEEHVAQVLTATLAGELARASKCRVLTTEEIRAVVNYESEKQVCGNEDASCLAELGSAMGVERIVGGTISKIGSAYRLQTRIVNIEEVVVEKRTERTTEDINALAGLAKQSASELLGQVEAEVSVEAPSKGKGLLWAGIGLGSVGALTTTAGIFWQLQTNGVLADPKTSRADKESAISNSKFALVVTVAGALIMVSGVGLAILGAGE